jgi:hypothetical protein
MIIPRDMLDAHIALSGLTEQKVAVRSQFKSFIDRSIFWARCEDVFIPKICQWRARYQYAGNVVLLMDSCAAHTFPAFEILCTQHGIAICLLPPHSSNQTLHLDLSSFGITKRLFARPNHLETVDIKWLHVAQVIGTLVPTTSLFNVVATFRNAGINLAIADEKLICLIIPRGARCLIAPVDLEGNPGDEAMPDGDVTEAQLYRERIVTETQELEDK